MAAKKFTSTSFNVAVLDHEFGRADIVFEELDHAGVSYKALVFLNNPNASDQTERTLDNGYAGVFHIFGHGGCLGDPGHCEVRGAPRLYDPRPAHPLTPARKVVIATPAVRKAIADGPDVTVTVVPIVTSPARGCDIQDVLKFDRLSIVTYR